MLSFIILKFIGIQMSKERLYTVDKRLLHNYISRTFMLHFIILNVHYTLNVSNESSVVTVYHMDIQFILYIVDKFQHIVCYIVWTIPYIYIYIYIYIYTRYIIYDIYTRLLVMYQSGNQVSINNINASQFRSKHIYSIPTFVMYLRFNSCNNN